MAKNPTRLNTPHADPGPQERVVGEHPIEDTLAGAITREGELALDGGKLPGNRDDFEDQKERTRKVPGADSKKDSLSRKTRP